MRTALEAVVTKTMTMICSYDTLKKKFSTEAHVALWKLPYLKRQRLYRPLRGLRYVMPSYHSWTCPVISFTCDWSSRHHDHGHTAVAVKTVRKVFLHPLYRPRLLILDE